MRSHDDLFKEVKNNPDRIVYKWVCCFHQRSGAQKVLRNIKPTYVSVIVDPEYWEKEKEHQQQKISIWDLRNYKNLDIRIVKNGKIMKKQINFYGNTTDSDGLHYFDTENECIKQYNTFIYEAVERIKLEKQSVINAYDYSIKNLEESFIGTDYMIEKLSH